MGKTAKLRFLWETWSLTEAQVHDEFIKKFGTELFDKFKKYKDRLKNANISTDFSYHNANTSVEEMQDIIYRMENRLKSKSEEEQFDKIAENENYTILKINNYKTAMKYGIDTVWCITGRYTHSGLGSSEWREMNVNPKESQAEEYFGRYLRHDYLCFLFALPKKSSLKKLCICPYKDNHEEAVIWFPDDKSFQFDPLSIRNNKNALDVIYNLPAFEYEGFSSILPDWIIKNGVLYGYYGKDKNIIIPQEVEQIASKAFEASDIKTIEGPEVTLIDSKAFANSKNLEEAKFPKITLIQEYAFENCNNLGDIYLGKDLKKIQLEAFKNCNNLSLNIEYHKGVQIAETNLDFIKSKLHWINKPTN